jgi:hypothetical protein
MTVSARTLQEVRRKCAWRCPGKESRIVSLAPDENGRSSSLYEHVVHGGTSSHSMLISDLYSPLYL